jgi:hypothetical protein
VSAKMKQLKLLFPKNSKNTYTIEKLLKKLVYLVDKFYTLPESIEIEFVVMDESTYGMTIVDYRFPNRIYLNYKLQLEELVVPAIHELCHLNQVYTNRLKIERKHIVWDNIKYTNDKHLTYQEYLDLPWEIDVAEKQQKLLEFLTLQKKQST